MIRFKLFLQDTNLPAAVPRPMVRDTYAEAVGQGETWVAGTLAGRSYRIVPFEDRGGLDQTIQLHEERLDQ